MATKHIQHLRSKELIDDTIITREDGTVIGDPKAPTADQIKEGEIAINYNASNEQLFIKNSDGNVVSLLNKDAITCVTAEGKDVLTLTSTLDDDGCVAISGSVDLTNYATTTELSTELSTKQDVLTAGTGIDISDNVISTTIDNNPFVFCEELPTTDIKEGKIYCVPNEESTEENNIWDEYYYANSQWELMGKYIPTVDLTPYAKKDEIPTKTSELENDSGYITENDVGENIYIYNLHAFYQGMELLQLLDSFGVFEDYELVELLNKIVNNSATIALFNVNGGTWDPEYGYSDEGNNTAAYFDGVIATASEKPNLADRIIYFIASDFESIPNFYKIGIGTKTNYDSETETTTYTFTITNEQISGNASAITSISASGTSPLTLSASTTNNKTTITGSVDLSNYQDKLTAGTGIDISTDNTISTTLIYDSTDENYVIKAVDENGTLLVAVKTSGEIYVPIGTTEDSYDLIYALYEKLADIISSLIDYGDATYDSTNERKKLIENSVDGTYVVKIQDAIGSLLIGVKESGEIDIPIGVTDDTYDLITALYEKLNLAIPALQDWCDNNYERTETRKALIDSTVDTNYVIKMEDAEGQVLQGIKENGEINIPIGISDDAYDLFTAIYNKLEQISDYLREISTK